MIFFHTWLNMVERWFAEITNKRMRRESWGSVKELVKAIIVIIVTIAANVYECAIIWCYKKCCYGKIIIVFCIIKTFGITDLFNNLVGYLPRTRAETT
jgi:hypothetical protein